MCGLWLRIWNAVGGLRAVVALQASSRPQILNCSFGSSFNTPRPTSRSTRLPTHLGPPQPALTITVVDSTSDIEEPRGFHLPGRGRVRPARPTPPARHWTHGHGHTRLPLVRASDARASPIITRPLPPPDLHVRKSSSNARRRTFARRSWEITHGRCDPRAPLSRRRHAPGAWVTARGLEPALAVTALATALVPCRPPQTLPQ